MLSIASHISKSSKNLREFVCFKQFCHSLKFWSKSNDSSKAVVKTNGKVSLAYYSLDPHYLTSNKLNPIIIYHSLLASKEMFQNSVKELAQKTGRIVYLLDMRNHGESPHTSFESSHLNQISKDVIDFMDEFGINKAILIGHGVGSLAMLRTSLLFNEKVDKVVAIDIMSMNLPIKGPKLVDRMLFIVSALPQYISLSNARLIAKQRLSRYFADKILLHYILLNLTQDTNGFIKWRFNLPVIRQIVIKGIDRSMTYDNQFSGDVLILSGKYGTMTANNYTQLKQSFPNSKFDFYHRFRHYLHNEKPKQLVNVLTRFIGKADKKKK